MEKQNKKDKNAIDLTDLANQMIILGVAGGMEYLEILDRVVTPFGNSAHISIPKKHQGKKARVVILKEEESTKK